MNIKGKTILVTGASDGIGKAITLRLAKENTNLILLGRDQSRLDEVKKAVEKIGAATVTTDAFDLGDKNSMTDHVETIRATHSDLAAIINCAGIWQKLGDADSLSHDDIETIISTNLTGLIKLTNTLLPILRKQPEAAIINISSRSGYAAQAGQAIYTASKYGVRGFTEVLREDLKGTKIHVAGVYQGGTNTNMFAKAGEDWPEQRYQQFIPPEELAEVVVFMLTRTNRIWLPEVRIENE